MSSVDSDWKARYLEIRQLNWIVLLVLAAPGAIFFEAAVAVGIIFGGLIIISNFGVMQFIMRHAFDAEETDTRFNWLVAPLSILRFLALIFAIFVMVGWKWADPVGLAVGLTSLPISIVAFAVREARRIYGRESS